jgi:hypothetical protein
MKRGDVIGISASKGAAILRKQDGTTFNKYLSEFQVWQGWIEKLQPGFNEKRGFKLPEKTEGAPLRWGKAFEPAVIHQAEKSRGMMIDDREYLFMRDFELKPVHSDKALDRAGKMIAYIDGRYSDGVIHEGKLTSEYIFQTEWGDPGTDHVPAEIYFQAQHGLIVTGADETIISLLVFPKRFDEFENIGWSVEIASESNFALRHADTQETISPIKWANSLVDMGYFFQYPIKRDEEIQNFMIKGYSDWWEKFINCQIVPDPKRYLDLKLMIPEPIGTIISPPFIERLFVEYKNLTEEMSPKGPLEKRREEIRVEVLSWARQTESTFDEESVEKWVFRNESGQKLGQFNGKVFLS